MSTLAPSPKRRWAYGFDELPAVMSLDTVAGKWEDAVALLGGKGAGLFRMKSLQLPVPPGFTITTEAGLQYLKVRGDSSAVPVAAPVKAQQSDAKSGSAASETPSAISAVEFLAADVKQCLRHTEAASGKALGSTSKPLLLSCRSGARVSMPGMMDTVLNIGLNDATAAALEVLTGNARFVQDSYRRLIQGFGSIVLGIDSARFEDALKALKKQAGYEHDPQLTADDWRAIVKQYKTIISAACANGSGAKHGLTEFPQDVTVQLLASIGSVFNSWNSARAVAYREKCGIPHSYGTACTIQMMVFGNTNAESATGVGFTRSPVTGERVLYGDYLVNAQGEDVVAGIRNTSKLSQLKTEFPVAYAELVRCCAALEKSFANMQDVEFTIENKVLFMLQCRNGKRTAKAQVKIAVDMVSEGLISRSEAIKRVSADDINTLLLPQLDPKQLAAAAAQGRKLTRGVNACPGGAVGRIVFDAETAKTEKAKGGKVILCRQFTKPEDVIGFFAAEGVLTVEGGATSHAAVVARQFGIPCIVGAHEFELDAIAKTLSITRLNANATPPQIVVVGNAHASDTKSGENVTLSGGTKTVHVLREGDWISLDATSGDVYTGQIARGTANFQNETELQLLLEWCDGVVAANGGLRVLTNADSEKEALLARSFGAQGLGLCRTEHTFFEADRLPTVQEMVMADTKEQREKCLAVLLPFQRKTFFELFRAMSGMPVVIRTLDPPLHEFLPDFKSTTAKLQALAVARASAASAVAGGANGANGAGKASGTSSASASASAALTTDQTESEYKATKRLLEKIERHSERNPMIGFRGCRVGILYPEIIAMQVTAMCLAALDAKQQGFDPRPELMIPLTVTAKELDVLKPVVDAAAAAVWKANGGVSVPFRYGTMIETPRAVLTAKTIAKSAEFFSFGTNDLTQLTFGMARDDAERHFLLAYVQSGVLAHNPFQQIDEDGVGVLVQSATAAGRAVRGVGMDIGICGEVGGDPKSIAFVHAAGLSYVSCSAFRIPVARLACAHAAIQSPRPEFRMLATASATGVAAPHALHMATAAAGNKSAFAPVQTHA